MSIENIFLEELKRVIGERYHGYQTEIAHALGIKTPTFSNMVCGRRGMDEDTRRKIASFVGIDYEAMVRANTNPTTAAGHYTPPPPTVNGHAVIGDHSAQIIDSQECTIAQNHSINTGKQPQSGKRLHDLSAKEEEALLLYRKYGNENLLNECIDRLRRVRDILSR